MRYAILSTAVFVTSALSANAASAQTVPRCITIADHDQRMTCYAVTSGLRVWCAPIKDPDKRAWCYVLVERK